jgi:hypothetical protein
MRLFNFFSYIYNLKSRKLMQDCFEKKLTINEQETGNIYKTVKDMKLIYIVVGSFPAFVLASPASVIGSLVT